MHYTHQNLTLLAVSFLQTFVCTNNTQVILFPYLAWSPGPQRHNTSTLWPSIPARLHTQRNWKNSLLGIFSCRNYKLKESTKQYSGPRGMWPSVKQFPLLWDCQSATWQKRWSHKRGDHSTCVGLKVKHSLLTTDTQGHGKFTLWSMDSLHPYSHCLTFKTRRNSFNPHRKISIKKNFPIHSFPQSPSNQYEKHTSHPSLPRPFGNSSTSLP